MCPLDLKKTVTSLRGNIQEFCARPRRSETEDDVPSGRYLEFYPKSHALRCEGQMQAGLRTGTWRCYHENGSKFVRQGYEGGLREGDGELYSETGSLEAREGWHEGLLDGRLIRYDPADGGRELVQDFRAGRAHGWLRAYAKGGRLVFERRFREGAHDGCAREREEAASGGLGPWTRRCD